MTGAMQSEGNCTVLVDDYENPIEGLRSFNFICDEDITPVDPPSNSTA